MIKGFLNLVIADAFYIGQLESISADSNFGYREVTKNSPLLLVEYSSPNTNKPLHLGHIRNNLLGVAVSNILEANGNRVHRTQIINDRGIHICKSMVAWKRYGNEETPEQAQLKGDHFVGKYYILFDKQYKEEIQDLIASGMSEKQAKQEAPIFLEAQEMLRLWEAKDAAVLDLWKKMNAWVYAGFQKTYADLGIKFDSYYYESKTYLLGKEVIEQGLAEKKFYRKKDGSVWVDLTDEGLDEKLLLRADGTSVYMTQDLGTALLRLQDHPDTKGMVYTVGNEQDYHFKVLFLILKKMRYEWAKNLFHLSYGMVNLPEGKMKSREGVVVDADDLIEEMQSTAEKISSEVGKLEGFSSSEKETLYRQIGLGALKYYLLKVDPKKRILFNPEDSVDFNGNTGPFVQYTHARIKTLLQKADFSKDSLNTSLPLDSKEKNIIKQLLMYPETLSEAAENYSPAIIANYIYELVRLFNTFYQNIPILGIQDASQKQFRIQLCAKTVEVISKTCKLLGIETPDRM